MSARFGTKICPHGSSFVSLSGPLTSSPSPFLVPPYADVFAIRNAQVFALVGHVADVNETAVKHGDVLPG